MFKKNKKQEQQQSLALQCLCGPSHDETFSTDLEKERSLMHFFVFVVVVICVLFISGSCSNSPDITVMVDWGINN